MTDTKDTWRASADAQRCRAEAAERRADTLERALRQIRTRPPSEAYEIARAALAQQEPDQPAQDGGRLDPYTLEWIARDCERRAEELCEAARENHQGCARGSYRDQEANHLENEAHSLMKRAEYYRNLQPDQPADAGEADRGVSTRQQISDAQERVAAWPEWMTKSAKVHEPSCCARTRAECARVAENHSWRPRQAEYHRGYDDCSREFAAAIRRTDGDTP